MKAPPIFLLVLSVIIILVPAQCFNRTEQSIMTLARPFGYLYPQTRSLETQDPKRIQSLKPKDKMQLLEQKNIELNNEILILQNENRTLVGKIKTLSDFRESLPTALNIKFNYDLAVADVIIKSDVSVWRRSIIINRGSNDNIKPGLTVVSGKCLVGKISEVGLYTSRIQLITDPAFRAQVVVAPPVLPASPPSGQPINKTETDSAGAKISVPSAKAAKPDDIPQPTFGVLAGISFNRSVVKWVSRETKASKDWNVFSAPDQNALIPKGLIIGKVDTVSINGFFYTLTINPALDFYSLNSVLILIPKTR